MSDASDPFFFPCFFNKKGYFFKIFYCIKFNGLNMQG